jgi:archaeal flagellar protein FlaI
MQFEKGAALYSTRVKREEGEDVLYINYSGVDFVPSVEENPEVMERVIDSLVENPNVVRVVLVQQKSYNYDFEETAMLMEIAQFYLFLMKQEKILSAEKLSANDQGSFASRYNEVFSFLYLLKKDPVGAYFELKKILFSARSSLERVPPEMKQSLQGYANTLEKLFSLLEKTKLIKKAKNFFGKDNSSERAVYYNLFHPDVIPNFTFTRLVLDLPDDAEIIDQYELNPENSDSSIITILKEKGESKLVYHLSPPENSIPEEYDYLLNLARNVLIQHQPKAEEFTDTERIRQVFFNIACDLLQDLASTSGVGLDYNDLNKLSTILVRHTIGFGLIEVLLQDKNLQDIVLNAPISQNRIFIRHQKHGECSTNILPSMEDANSWAAKFRMISGRPLDEANPILDTQLEIGSINARIAVIQRPLSPDGIAYAIRRHREDPWTLPLFVENKMLNSFAAGLLSFLIDGSRTLLVAGTRSSGKTSLLGSLMLEIVPKHRIIVIEDSLELPSEALRKLNYNIQRMKVRSALLKSDAEVSADDGIRTSLRLGDSCLIIGEVRSTEAKALYEAMRVGALANVVAGTIHGASPYGVFDRVVNDLGVPATSFKATDIIVVCNPIKTPDGLHFIRRVLSITEVRKNWSVDPSSEAGFVELMRYNVEKDELEPTEDLINGDSEIIKEIASKVKGWAGNWDAIYDNILLRAKIKEELVEMAKRTGQMEILEAEFNSFSNYMFHQISEKVSQERGLPLSERVFPEWKKWLESEIKRRKWE